MATSTIILLAVIVLQTVYILDLRHTIKKNLEFMGGFLYKLKTLCHEKHGIDLTPMIIGTGSDNTDGLLAQTEEAKNAGVSIQMP